MTICEITTSICVSVSSHTLYRWYNTQCIYDMAPTIFMAQHALYMTSKSRFMISQPLSITSVYYISYQTDYIWQHIHCISVITPDYWSYKPHWMYDNTGTICVTSYEYIWHHIHSLRYHTMLWPSHTLYSCYHTQYTCHRIHCSWAITYSVLIIAHLQYVWYQTHYMYDIIWILCDITTTIYDIRRLYS